MKFPEKFHNKALLAISKWHMASQDLPGNAPLALGFWLFGHSRLSAIS
jgi:hypothetical protein